VPVTKTSSQTHVSAPVAAPAAPTAPGTLLHNFNGMSSRDSMETNYNAEFEPPDPSLCVGNGFVLNVGNSAYNIYRKDGTRIRGPFNINDLFNEGGAEFTTDPRCYFDKPTNTWFATILFINSSFTESHLDLAVNTSGDPTGFWTQYRIDSNDDGRLGEPSHPGCPCIGDQPLIGIDQYNVYLSTNEFSLAGPEFNGAQIYAVSKKDLRQSQPAHFVHFDNLSNGGAVAASLQPATNAGSPPAEYFMDSLDPNGTFDNRLGVWAMTNRKAVSTGGSPILTNVVINSEAYGVPPNATQKGSTSEISSNDDRMQQVQFLNGTLWASLPTAVTIPNDSAERAGAAWFAVRPTLSGDHVAGAVIQRQGYVADKGGYLLFPAMMANSAGQAVMVFTSTNATIYPSAAYAVLAANASSFGPVTIGAAGTGPYDKKAGRWGDYSYVAADPTTNAIWTATEYIPPKSSQTPDGRRNWGTRVMSVSLS
jgi:hypothetical protein